MDTIKLIVNVIISIVFYTAGVTGITLILVPSAATASERAHLRLIGVRLLALSALLFPFTYNICCPVSVFVVTASLFVLIILFFDDIKARR